MKLALPMLELRELIGFVTVTCGKNILNCEYNNVTSLPLNILATKVPPFLSK